VFVSNCFVDRRSHPHHGSPRSSQTPALPIRVLPHVPVRASHPRINGSPAGDTALLYSSVIGTSACGTGPKVPYVFDGVERRCADPGASSTSTAEGVLAQRKLGHVTRPTSDPATGTAIHPRITAADDRQRRRK